MKEKISRKVFKKIATLLICVTILILIILYNDSRYFKDKLGDITFTSRNIVKNKIFIYTPYFGYGWKIPLSGEPIFKDSRCIYATDPKDLNTSSVVFFHLWDLKRNDLPSVKWPSQKWIMFNMEPAVLNRCTGDYQLFRNVSPHFDLTMTYRMDSDIPIPYGRVIARDGKVSDVTVDINFKEKSKDVAWFVSNCNSFSNREEVVRQMKQFIPIDVYGKCGDLKCPNVDRNKVCYEMLSKTYKFYLSFENSICKDYATEKLFEVMNHDVIPVVYGGANYTHILPYNSYIDITNFTSVEELVRYMQYVGNNETIYKSYFEWRKKYQVVTDGPDLLCDLLLNDKLSAVGNGNFFDWWFSGADSNNWCAKKRIWFWKD